VASIAAALERVAARVSPGTGAVAVGVGAFLARAAAERCGLTVHADSAVSAAGWPFGGAGGVVAAAFALSVLGRE
jgi:hypothetical protein